MRAVLDTNVLISALLSASGAPALALRAWQQGEFELIVSPLLLAELERAMAYPKLRRRIPAEDAERVIEWLEHAATIALDPKGPPPLQSVDPADAYLLSLAAAERALLVSGDDHLLDLCGQLPVYSPRSFMSLLEADR